MTYEEAQRLARVLETADSGCPACVDDICQEATAAFPAFVWAYDGNAVVVTRQPARRPPMASEITPAMKEAGAAVLRAAGYPDGAYDIAHEVLAQALAVATAARPATDRAEQVPGRPDARCHACGLEGYPCADPECPIPENREAMARMAAPGALTNPPPPDVKLETTAEERANIEALLPKALFEPGKDGNYGFAHDPADQSREDAERTELRWQIARFTEKLLRDFEALLARVSALEAEKAAAVEAEREACARIAEGVELYQGHSGARFWPALGLEPRRTDHEQAALVLALAAAIRARGGKHG